MQMTWLPSEPLEGIQELGFSSRHSQVRPASQQQTMGSWGRAAAMLQFFLLVLSFCRRLHQRRPEASERKETRTVNDIT
ncbi:hypothetical protein K402DRAFT_202086 [Aulographum hederae CBS 113979]|uniref:Uncharacterized protein n=1 Tax=Aulographum hederae CBS 113979 TaxID=1176131 RepID=A0A6G1HCE6_9PEZI|nr:hypothetical protein K402DRAFT_202086 [Aulographum hederae CBS 113979]